MKWYTLSLLAIGIVIYPIMSTVDAAEIHCAAWRDDWKSVKEQLAKGVDVNLVDGYGNTALIAAASVDANHVLRRLLQVDGIDVNLVDEHGNTALICAVKEGAEAAVQRLLQIPEIDAHHANKDGNTALDLAESDEIGQLIQDHISKVSGSKIKSAASEMAV